MKQLVAQAAKLLLIQTVSRESYAVSVSLEGKVAARLYDILALHGVDKKGDDGIADLLGIGSYTTTSDDLIRCVEEDGVRVCSLEYDAVSNTVLPPIICE
jgi:hypothetical protein